MRTTVNLDQDVVASIEALRARKNLGLSEALNELARAGAAARAPERAFVQRSGHLGMRMDMTNVADVLALLDEP